MDYVSLRKYSPWARLFLCSAVVVMALLALSPPLEAAAEQHPHGKGTQFPLPLDQYDDDHLSLLDKLQHRIQVSPFNLVASLIFLCAILHTFLAGRFMHISHVFEKEHRERIEREGRTARHKPHHDAKDDVCFRSMLFHFLGEIEAIFGIWVIALAGAFLYYFDWDTLTNYVTYSVNYTEPLFVIIVMAIASSRPVIRFAENCLKAAAQLGKQRPQAWWLAILTIAPILGSFITEPAAMTIGALLLAKKFFVRRPPKRFAYATLGLLFVNVSVGGTLTHFAAPPVLMVASRWNWDMSYMFTNFGWKAVVAILFCNCVYFFLFRKDFAKLSEPEVSESSAPPRWGEREDPIPLAITAIHLGFLAWTVFTNHYPPLFIGGFLFFLAFVMATEHHQNDVNIRSPLLVGFFLAGLVIHGGCQGWWIAPVLGNLGEWPMVIGATVLTAFNDNAAITYLASQVPGLSEELKYAVVAGAVAGGGLTVIANAPNPAGQSILSRFFDLELSPLYLMLGALFPTVVMVLAFMLL